MMGLVELVGEPVVVGEIGWLARAAWAADTVEEPAG